MSVIERKAVAVEFKTRKSPGEFDALFSFFGNIDMDGDRIHKGAFEPAIKADPNPAVVWTHQWNIPPIGETLDWGEVEDGAKATGRLFLKEHPVAQQVWVGLESGALKEFSFALLIGKHSFSEPEDGEKSPRWDGKVREIEEIKSVPEWGPTLKGANPNTEMLTGKSLGSLLGLEALGLQVTVSPIEGKAETEPEEGEPEPVADEADPEKSARIARLLAERPMLHLHSLTSAEEE